MLALLVATVVLGSTAFALPDKRQLHRLVRREPDLALTVATGPAGPRMSVREHSARLEEDCRRRRRSGLSLRARERARRQPTDRRAAGRAAGARDLRGHG